MGKPVGEDCTGATPEGGEAHKSQGASKIPRLRKLKKLKGLRKLQESQGSTLRLYKQPTDGGRAPYKLSRSSSNAADPASPKHLSSVTPQPRIHAGSPITQVAIVPLACCQLLVLQPDEEIFARVSSGRGTHRCGCPPLPLQIHYLVSYLGHLLPVQFKKTQVLITPLFPSFLGVINDLSDNIHYFKPYLNCCLTSINLNTRKEG